MRVETYPNGEGKVLHLWHDEISGLNEKEIEEVAKEFIEVSNTDSWQHYGRLLEKITYCHILHYL